MENMCVHTQRERVFTFGLRRGVGGKERNENHTHRKKSPPDAVDIIWRSSGERWKN